jgi:beta-lactamase class A
VPAPAFALDDGFAVIEAKVGGRLGVAALDVTSGARLGYRGDERFPMCSTFKVMAVATLLSRVDLGQDQLGREVRYGPSDLIAYSPATTAQVQAGAMALGDLCQAAIELSDNTAANLILAAVGGPSAVTRFARSIGDGVSRFDRAETSLNSAIPGDPRDTTSPLSTVANLRRLCVDQGAPLTPDSRRRLLDWMIGCKTGDARLRAGLPASWRVGDKTGTGERGTANDIAVAQTPSGPVIIAAYLTGAMTATGAARDQALADVGRAVAAALHTVTAVG